MNINESISTDQLKSQLSNFWKISGEKIRSIEKNYDTSQGSPVFTVKGQYSTRGWTEWTQGFQYGSSILQFDATNDQEFLDIGKEASITKMPPHIGHFGVHDHGFNNVSTYGNLLRLMKEGKIPEDQWEKHFYELALKLSGIVQAKRWTNIETGGFIYSFNGPHSLFVDTIRSVRALIVSFELGGAQMDENDQKISLLDRAIKHMKATAEYSVFYGNGRDIYDVSGRTAHECVFNLNDGRYRCPNSQQGYTGFSTWTRGLAWAMLGFAEELEYFQTLPQSSIEQFGNPKELTDIFLKAAQATCDFYIENTPTDGIPYWDTGAPQLHKLNDYLNKPADPFNDYEPVDSSAAAIGAQALLRLGKYLSAKGDEKGKKYWQAGLTVLNTLFQEPYLSTDPAHQGLILHSIYHQPNGWDYTPPGQKIPCGESSMWGDYHAREVALYLSRVDESDPYYTFFGCVKED